jgi:acyl-CoA hydrolase
MHAAGAGVVMKMIDNAAGIVAFRHCKTNIVTAALDCMDQESALVLCSL